MPEFCLRVTDIETTGFLQEQPAAVQADPRLGVVEIGFTDVLVNVEDNQIKAVEVDGGFGALLFKPPGGIPPEASAVHHLLDRDVADAPECTPGAVAMLFTSPPWRGPPGPMALVAHNAEFEMEWLSKYLPADAKWICSMKVAAQLFRDWPSMGNQALKYRLGLQDLPAHLCHPPHRAGPDSFVTAHLVAEFVRRGTPVRQMLQWTREPRFYPTFPFGDWRGRDWGEVDAGMLRWTIENVPKHKNDDAAYWSKIELERRAALAADPALTDGGYG